MSEDDRMTPYDHAMIDCMKTIIELLHSKGIVTHDEFLAQFQHQRKQHEKTNPYGVSVFLILESFCREYGTTHKLIEEPPAGSA
ncbi:MAG: hypothetical protein Q8L15_05720 [Methylobacter sp.]|nr:hypothetical protein [Methylobacter sp.]